MSIDEALNPQDPQDSSYQLGSIGAITNQPLEGGTTDRTLPRQIAAGNQRGILNILGSINIANTSTGKTTLSLDGASQSITITDGTTNNTSIALSGANSTLIFTNPTTKINQVIIGKLPDGTYGMAISKLGIDVLTAFS